MLTNTDNLEEISKINANKQEYFLKIDLDNNGYFINVVNKKLEEIELKPENFGDIELDLVEYIYKFKEESKFSINWFNPNNKLYLHENSDLLILLEESNKLIDKSGNKLVFSNIEGNISLLIDQKKKQLETTIKLSHDNKDYFSFKLINENTLIVDNQIIKVKNIGQNYEDLFNLNTDFSLEELNFYLKDFFTSFDNIDLNYKDYKTITKQAINALPALIFEHIDEQNYLHLRIINSMDGFDLDYLEKDRTKIVVEIENETKKIILKRIEEKDINAIITSFERRLLSYGKKKINISFLKQNNYFILSEDLAKQFIKREFSNLIETFVIFGSEKLKDFKFKNVKPKLNISLSHGIDFLEGDVDLEIDGENISLFDAIKSFQKNSYIQLSNGTNALINKSYMNKIMRIFKKKKDKVKVSFFDLPFIEDLIEDKIFSESLERSKEIYMGFNKLSETEYSFPPIKADLRDYQKQGFKWLTYLYENNLGGCLADDMGLGKTVQTLTLLYSIYPKEKRPSLIVMPKSLIFNWENEIKKFCPDLSLYIYYADSRNLNEAINSNIIITTYSILRNDIRKFKEHEFYYTILDESQNIKNIASQTSKAVMLVEAKHRLALSGTPIENNLGELYSLFRFLNPSMFGTRDDFQRNYMVPIQKEEDPLTTLELRKKIYPFILRRLKKDVLKDLPDKTENIIYVEMNEKQKSLYEERRNFFQQAIKQKISVDGVGKSQFYIFQALSELRKIASMPESFLPKEYISSKREILGESLKESIDNNHKVLIFTNFLDVINNVSKDLEKMNVKHVVMTGATRNRQVLVKQFQNDPETKVFLMTLKTGGLGLNLTEADYVFIFDPWWNIAAENQAVDRTHRIGQKNKVFCYKLITKGTIEEKILKLQQKKSELFNNIISSDSASIKSLDEEDLEYILGN